MGTRATIRINGKLIYATHWDGYPDSLGADLVALRKAHNLGLGGISQVAVKHSINFADKSILAQANKAMITSLKGKEGYESYVKSGEFVTDIKYYDDFSEYEYDINTRTGKIKVTELNSSYKSRTKGKTMWI